LGAYFDPFVVIVITGVYIYTGVALQVQIDRITGGRAGRGYRGYHY
jgi:hypothetical protein